MTKSIEAQAEEYAMGDGATIEKRKCFTVDLHLGNPQQYEYVKIYNNNSYRDFLAGAKARDVEWLKVVNELRSIILSQPRYTDNNQMEVVERDSFKTAMNRLTKADQMLKEMGMKL